MNVVSIAVVLGTLVAAAAAFVTLRLIWSHNPLGQIRSRWPRRLSACAAIAAFPFAWWLSFVVGGNFGGALAASLSTEAIEGVAVPLGIGGGLALGTFIVVTTVGALVYTVSRSLTQSG